MIEGLGSGCGGSSKVNAVIEEELTETNKLHKIFKGVKDEKSFDYAVTAMEQPCTSLAHLRKQREELISKMAPSEMKRYEESESAKNLDRATSKMVDAMFDARRFMPNRAFEIDDVWRKAGLGTIGGKQ